MALDINSLLDLELGHMENAEQHRDLTPRTPATPTPRKVPRRSAPREQAPCTHLSSALRRHHPTHEASKGPAEYRGTLERHLRYVSGQGLHGYSTNPSSPGAPTKEWEEDYAIDITDMTAYVESVEDPEKEKNISLFAYHSWRWGHQVTLHQPQSEPNLRSPEQTAKLDIVAHLIPEGFYIVTNTADYPTPHTLHRRRCWPSAMRSTRTHPPRRNVIWTSPRQPRNTSRTGSPSVTSSTTTMPPTTRRDAAHCPCSVHHSKAPSIGGKSSPAPRRSRTCGSKMRGHTRSALARTSSSP